MSKSHWQIVKHDDSGAVREGGFKTLTLEEADPELISVALKAANLIGDGFYGVDIKHTSKGYVVMEVNDNPNIDSGVEDVRLGNQLYEAIMRIFLQRLEKRANRNKEIMQ